MAQPTAQEQGMLELLNRMRQNPAAELDLLLNSGDPLIQQALDFFKVDKTLLRQQWAQLTPAAPLAWSSELNNSATGHNQKLIAADAQSHQLPSERSILERAIDAGYAASAVGENIYSYSESVLFGHAGFAIDWGNAPGGIQSPAAHRQFMTSNNYREVGIAIAAENDPKTTVGPLVITQDFGNRTVLDNEAWLLGVAYQDLNNNQFYDMGEGLKDIKVKVTRTSQPSAQPAIVNTWDAGGYQTLLAPGQYQVQYLWTDPNTQKDILLDTQTVAVDPGNIANIKRDLRLNQPTISITNASVLEGNVGNSNAVFTVSLSNPSLELVTVDYASTSNTAISGSDFIATSGTLTFAPGETSKDINVLVVGDTTVEDNEVFNVNLTRPVNSHLNSAQAAGTIINDDVAPPTSTPTPVVSSAPPPVTSPTAVSPATSSAPQLQSSIDNLLAVSGIFSPFSLRFTPIQSGSGSDEIGVFAVDDQQGRISGFLPSQDGYLPAALNRSQTIFSTLSGNFFDPTSSRQISFSPGQQLRFFKIDNGTTNEVKSLLSAGKNPKNVIIGDGSALQFSRNGDKLNLAWNSSSSNLKIQVELSNQPATIGNSQQGQVDIIDLRGNGRTLLANFSVKSDATYNNQVGFYTVDDALTGRIGTLNPGDAGYAEEAIKRSVVGIDRNQGSIQQQIAGDPILAPYLVANASNAKFLTENPSNQAHNGPQAYFAYLGANPDQTDHIKLLGDNYFGFEDTFGGGDKDYNDIVLNVKFT